MRIKNTTSREYAIYVQGCEYADVLYSYGISLGEAKYNLWLKISDCGYWESFFDFAKNCKGKLVSTMMKEV